MFVVKQNSKLVKKKSTNNLWYTKFNLIEYKLMTSNEDDKYTSSKIMKKIK